MVSHLAFENSLRGLLTPSSWLPTAYRAALAAFDWRTALNRMSGKQALDNDIRRGIVKKDQHMKPCGKKSSWSRRIKSHLRLAGIEFVFLLFNHDFIFGLVGKVNRVFSIIESVFLVYPATEKYARSYGYPHRLSRIKWSPAIAGFLWQDGRMTVMFGISATEGELKYPVNSSYLIKMCERLEHIRLLLGARRKSFAGIIPGILYFRRIVREAQEADLTASAVVAAIEQVKKHEGLDSDTKVVVLGGRGFIGRRVMALLDGNSSVSIDTADGQGKADFGGALNGHRNIIVNITSNKAIYDYLDLIQPGSVLINEVYPELDKTTLDKLSGKSCVCYHISGIKGKAFPSFPSAYNGSIPCCAAWPSSGMEVTVRKMTHS